MFWSYTQEGYSQTEGNDHCPKGDIKMARTLALVGEMDGCALWRVLQPCAEIQRQYGIGIAEWGMRDDNRLADLVHRFDAVILPRLHWPAEERSNADRWFDSLHRAGLHTIYEVDDDLFSEDFVRRLVTLHSFDEGVARERQESILHAVQRCDGVTVSSQRLATLIRNYTSAPVRVVPNYIDLRWFKQVQRMASRKVQGLTIGWAGGNRADTDFQSMAEAWSRLAKRYPFITFVIQGHHSKLIYDMVPNERIAMLDWLPIHQYPQGLVNIDIGCCPLSDTKFNRSKTFIKAMEYAASGASVVASPTVYSQLIDHGVNGYLASTADEWEEYLSRLIEDYTHRQRMNKALMKKIRNDYTLERNAWRWLEAWDGLINTRVVSPKEVQYA